jgi:Phage integrase family
MCEATRAVFRRKLWLPSGFRFLIPCKSAGIAVPFLPTHQTTPWPSLAEIHERAKSRCPALLRNIDSWKYSIPRLEGRCSIQLSYEQTEKAASDSIRVVELSPQACAHLKTFLKSWHSNERRLLFATCNGTPWDQNLLLKRRFRPLLRSLGIHVPRGNGFHAFRHANATLMNSFGASQKLRQQRLGHADGSPVTETIYTHVISEDGKRIAAQLGRQYGEFWTPVGPKKENGSEGASSKPLYLN